MAKQDNTTPFELANRLATLRGRRACVLGNRAYYMRRYLYPDGSTDKRDTAKKIGELSRLALAIQSEILGAQQ